MADTKRITIRIGHSPDPDDAFMWYPLANFPAGSGPGGRTYKPCIDTGVFEFVHVLEDIQSLNERAQRAELEVTALSIHQYPYVAKHYALTNCGASMGDGYGPMVVAREKFDLLELPRKKLAIPGRRTSAWLALQLRLRGLTIPHEVVGFDEIIGKVASGAFDAGLIIHEGQLTYAGAGLVCLEDLGKWWKATHGLPLPLGGNAIRRDLMPQAPQLCRVLLKSIEYALSHREEAVEYALNYARSMGAQLADRFVGMYVNQWTLDYGDAGRKAIQQFLAEAAAAGITPNGGQIDFISPA